MDCEVVHTRDHCGRPPAIVLGPPAIHTKAETMPTDILVWTGDAWESTRGPQGPEGPTAVSADAGNVARLGTDGKVLVAQADLNAKYVEVAGDTMTGPLGIKVGATITPPATAISTATVLNVVREGGSALIETYSVGATGTTGLYFRRKFGTLAAPAPVAANIPMGVIRWQVKPNNGAADRTAAQISFNNQSPETEDGYFDNTLGISNSGYAAGKPAAGIALSSTAANGSTFVVTAENFFVTADGYFTASKGNFVVSGAQAKNTVTAGSGVTAVGFYGFGVGTSATSNVLGLRGEVTGTVSTGTGVAAVVSATATQNYGLSSIVSGGTRNCGLYVDVPKASGSYAVQCQGDADSYFKTNVGIGWSTPTVLLEVGGAARVRSTLEVVGNITSAGTAHSFAANSIPSPAVVGGAAFTPANSAAAGSPGSIRWDENFLYVRTATAWKRIALATF